MSLPKKFFLFTVTSFFLALSCFALWASAQYTVPIIMYHNVEASETPQPNWVSPERFAWQMEFLYKHGYHVISLDALINAISHNKKLSRKSVVLTFDDGYESNYINAFEVLKEYEFPATIFIPSGFIGKQGYLTLGQITEMAAHGIDIGSHTHHNVYLPALPVEKQREEIFTSKAALEKVLGRPVKHFAYPIGGFSEEVKEFIKEAGYHSACTTNRGSDKLNKDVYQLNRIRFSDKDNRWHILFAKLWGYYNLFRSPKKPH